MSPAARLTLSVTLVATLMAFAPARALGDADPPSDFLLTQDVYLPYEPPVAKPLAAALRSTVERAKKAGYPIKVAVIARDADLGAVANLFNKPGAYAPFLARELSSSTVPTLVVMPAGLAAANATQPAVAALERVQVDKTKNSDELARAVIEAIPKMATASGHPVAATKLPAGAGRSGGGGASPLIVFGAPVALVALAALVVGLRRRRGEDDEASPDTESGVGSGS